MTRSETTDLLDDVYDRFRPTGPEFHDWLSNHGPMAADSLARIGHADQVERWVDDYIDRLEARPAATKPIDPTRWRNALSDPRRLGDWAAYFENALEEQPWRDVLTAWWPRLLPGAVAGATHGLIRTGHAVRALTEDDTAARRAELAQGLGYWAARWRELPAHRPPSGTASVRAAVSGISAVQSDGRIHERLEDLARSADWKGKAAALTATSDPRRIPAAIDELVDATVAKYATWGGAAPVMLVHASTAPRAAGLAITALPEELWVPTYEVAWAAVAALVAIYRPAHTSHPRLAESRLSTDDLGAAIATQGDPHGLKFAEVAFESHARGNPLALTAVARSHEWLAE